MLGGNILVADDEKGVVNLFQEILTREGYRVFVASDGKEAIEIASKHSIDLAILDLRMPVMGGLDALRRIRESDPFAAALVMTGQPDMESLNQFLELGALDYLVKPFRPTEIVSVVRRALEKQEVKNGKAASENGNEERTRRLVESQIRYREVIENCNDAIVVAQDGKLKFLNPKALELVGRSTDELIDVSFSDLIHPEDRSMVIERHLRRLKGERLPGTYKFRVLGKDGQILWVEINAIRSMWNDRPATLNFIRDITDRIIVQEKLEQSNEKLRRALEGTIQAMALAVETRDPYTAGHQRRVAELAVAIATELGLSGDQIEGVRMAGLIHDIGKLSLPTDILSKPGRLTDTEFSLIQDHCQAGFDILKGIEFPWPLAQIVLQHHERFNGSGYPLGLVGGDISLEARILGVADVVEAMASHRPYRPALGIGAALEEILEKGGSLYDPEVTRACLRLFTEKGYRLHGDGAEDPIASYLIIQNAAAGNQFFPVTGRSTIGRGEKNDVCLTDEKVSRLHAVVYPIGDRVFMEDLGSRNGTFVNEEKVAKALLSHGDTVTIGNVNIQYYQEAQQTQPEPSLFETQATDD